MGHRLDKIQAAGRYFLLIALAVVASPARAQVGLDATGLGGGVAGLERRLSILGDEVAPLWLQVGELQWALHAGVVEETRAILQEYKRRGHRLCIEVRFIGRQRYAPLRNQMASAPPENLLKVFAECGELGREFGDLVDAWEIENEPELGYFWGTSSEYAAVLKAAYLGLWRGIAERESEKQSAMGKGQGADEFPMLGAMPSAAAPNNQELITNNAQVAQPLVLMSPMGLPPGPFFENLAANDLFAYTDGFNFHFYGYADDFPGIYARWEERVKQAASRQIPWWRRFNPADRLRRKALPVFITEYGNGMLTAAAAQTPEGRSRQERWHADLLGHLRLARPAAAMAFRLAPTAERGIEFGLTRAAQSPDTKPETEARLVETPALRAILHEAEKEPWVPRPWRIRQPTPASPVVLDVLPGAGWRMDKDIDGYWIAAGRDDSPPSGCRIRIYNFSEEQVRGRLRVRTVDGKESEALSSTPISVEPGEYLEWGLEVGLGATAGRPVGLQVEFLADSGRKRLAVLATNLRAAGRPTAPAVVALTASGAVDEGKLAMLRTRSRPADEPQTAPHGRWLLTPGLSVKEEADRWIFVVESMPGDGARRAVAELPWPETSEQRKADRLVFQYSGSPAGSLVETQIRTARGNLYGPWRQQAMNQMPQTANLLFDQLTLQYYGRATRPARFTREKPVSLVFQFRPTELPASYVIERPSLMEEPDRTPRGAGVMLRWGAGR